MVILKDVKIYLVLIVSLVLQLNAATSRDTLDVYANIWPPYVNTPGAAPGMATKIVGEVLREADKAPQFRYLDYSVIYELLKRGDVPAAYPYFKTVKRENEVHFSKYALLEIENRIYYNRHKNGPSAWKDIRDKPGSVHGVIGYEYGEKYISPLLDNNNLFKSEVLALRALVEGEIDYLPMERQVKDALMHRYFPEHIYKIKALTREDGSFVSEVAPLFMVFPKNKAGKVLRDAFDAAYESLGGPDAFESIREADPILNSFHVNLVTTDNIPFIIGQDVYDTEAPGRKVYAIPPGSRGIVLEWSESILMAGQSESVYPAMMDRSLVRLISGPHTGKELWIKNVHLEID